jgi:hypothetical protein
MSTPVLRAWPPALLSVVVVADAFLPLSKFSARSPNCGEPLNGPDAPVGDAGDPKEITSAY